MRLCLAGLLACVTTGISTASPAYAPTIAEIKELDRRFDLYRKPGGAALTLEAKMVRDGASYDAMAFQSGALIPDCDPQAEPHCFAIDSWTLTVESPADMPGEIRQVRWRFFPHRANRSEDIKKDGHIVRQVEYARERNIADDDVVEASALTLSLLLNPPNGYDQTPAIFNH